MKTQLSNKRLAILFNITFFFGYLFRILTMGWILFATIWAEYIFRCCYYLIGAQLIKGELDKNKRRAVYILQLFYLLTSFFSYDGSDKNAYTFAQLWINPPEYIGKIWITLALLTFILMFYYLVTYITPRVYRIWFLNPLMGFIIIPSIALLAGHGISKLS